MKKFSPIIIMNTFIRSITILVGLVFFVGCNETLKPKEEMISEKVISSEAKSIDYNSEKDNFKMECFTTYYKGKLFTGELVKYGRGDYLKIKANYNNGIQNNFSEYYDNGQIEIESSYLALTDTTIGLHGSYKEYYRNGQKKIIGDFHYRKMYNEIKNANIISKELSSNSDITLNDFLKSKKLVFEPPIKGYNISGFDMLKKDIRSLSKTTKDKNYKKILKKSLVEISQLERNFLIVENLNNHNITDQQRPLYFFQSKDRITVGNIKKNTARRIVPFEFYKKKLLYGLTAAGTSDLGSQPFNGSYPMVGLHANALNTILSDIFITRTS